MMPSKSSRRKRAGLHAYLALIMVGVSVFVFLAGAALAASQSKTVSEIALYQGPDRGKRLIEGARNEKQFTLYTTNSWMARQFRKEFGKKYPFLEISVWQGDSKSLIKRVLEEYAAGQLNADAIEATLDSIRLLHKKGIFQECYSPEAANYPEEAKEKGKTGNYYLADFMTHNSLGYNTTLIPPADVPKTYNDLLDPRWKGKMAIANVATTIRWIGSLVDALGLEYLEKLSRQNLRVHNITVGALGNLVVSGEVQLSPTITDYTVFNAKKKRAPIEWRPLDPVLTSTVLSGISTRTTRPYAALLFMDYIHSKEGQKMIMQGGLSSPRKDTEVSGMKFKSDDVDNRYSIEQFETKYSEWEGILKRLFLQKR